MERYRVLRIMAVVYKVLAWVALLSGIALSIGALVASSILSQQLGRAAPVGGGFVAFFVTLVYALISFGGLYALSEIIYLLFDIDRNTRTAAGVKEKEKPAA